MALPTSVVENNLQTTISRLLWVDHGDYQGVHSLSDISLEDLICAQSAINLAIAHKEEQE